MNYCKAKKISEYIESNSYPGRGIIVGKTKDSLNAVIAYFIMGRSENSRNRMFVENGEEVIIKPIDESKVEDASLIIYSPLKRIDNKIILTNGDQTDTIYDYLLCGKSFFEALQTRTFEPDAPNFTPRISALLDFGNDFGNYSLSIIKSAHKGDSACVRELFEYSAVSGEGHFIHTYKTDGNPIPSFCGEPKNVIIDSDIDEFTNEIWNALDFNNKISLFVRYIDIKSGTYKQKIINKSV